MQVQLGTGNILDISGVPGRAHGEDRRWDSPVVIRERLGLERLENDLFPLLVTGVSLWPFLAIAQNSQRAVKATETLRKDLGRRVGPKERGSLRPYRSMYARIRNSHSPGAKALLRFLDAKAEAFSGKLRCFGRHEKIWKRLLLDACGSPGKDYCRAARSAGRDARVDDVVDWILSHPGQVRNRDLKRAAFSYAFLVCLFGDFDKDEKKVWPRKWYAERWPARLLERRWWSDPNHGGIRFEPRYRKCLEWIRKNPDAEPPLAHVTKRFRKDDRPVLAGLRLGVFHRLYYRPTPAGGNQG